MKRRTFTAEGGSVGAELTRALQIDDARAHELTEAGAVYVDGKRCRDPKRQVPAGAQLIAVLEEAGRVASPTAAPVGLRVLYEDPRLIAVDKPPGVLAQPGPSGGDNLLEQVSAHLGREAGLVHRLDRETSGVTVFGKSRAATSELARLFREGQAKKQYLAVVTAPLPDGGTIDLPLSKDPSRPGRWRASKQANGLSASTCFEVRERRGEKGLVTLFPATGRTHQLRAHLTALGAPIAGDRLYGGVEGPRCLLHAQVLQLGELTLEAPVPEDLRAFFEA
ncbi:MAG: RluA family pseudouridine synthase [Archangiaceae bacterium]|nr:RluA family pseudouridine synthase [Archangiaceae bacterium]